MTTPNQRGYLMPAEWEEHAATQLHWPSNDETWPGERLARVEDVYVEIIQKLHRYEDIILLLDHSVDIDTVKNKIDADGVDFSKIHISKVPLNDVWARDCGPIFVEKSEPTKGRRYAIINWGYNAWGEKYPPFDSDNQLPAWFASEFNLVLFEPDMILEGGSIDTNGEGIFLTTESVLLNKNRNPNLTKNEIEQRLVDYLGAKQIIWLRNGLAGDDTDGHIDDISRFLNKNTILTMICTDPADINYDALHENYEILLQSRNHLNGEPFQIVTLPLPKTKIEGTTVDGSEYVPASYANFYIVNGAVLVPLYDDRYDHLALDLFTKFFPERDIIGIECSDLVWGQGSIHCITQQLYGLPGMKKVSGSN